MPNVRTRPYRRRIRNYLLDSSLQLRYVILVTALSAAISAALGYLIWRQEEDASAHVMEAYDSLGMQDVELREQILDRTSTGDQNLVLTMAGAGLGLMAVLFLYLVIMTHKVAGPLYKVSRAFDEMAAGRLGQVYSLRKRDMLQDFYDEFRAMHESLRQRVVEDVDALRRFLAACDAARMAEGGALASPLQELREHVDRRTKALG